MPREKRDRQVTGDQANQRSSEHGGATGEAIDDAHDYAPGGVHDELRADIMRRCAGLVALRRWYHQRPELSFEEHATAAAIADHLRRAGLDVREGVGETGVVGVLDGTKAGDSDGRTLLVRADIDALPIAEANDVPYRSQTPDVMHACGHDGHMAIALTLAELLAARREQLRGNVVFAFQPAEERI